MLVRSVSARLEDSWWWTSLPHLWAAWNRKSTRRRLDWWIQLWISTFSPVWAAVPARAVSWMYVIWCGTLRISWAVRLFLGTSLCLMWTFPLFPCRTHWLVTTFLEMRMQRCRSWIIACSFPEIMEHLRKSTKTGKRSDGTDRRLTWHI